MAGAGDHRQSGPRDGVVNRLADAEGRSLVGISPDEERWDADGREKLARVGVRQSGSHQPKTGWMEIGHDVAELVANLIARRVAEHAGQVLLNELGRRQRRVLDTPLKALFRLRRWERAFPAGIGARDDERHHPRWVTPVKLLR